MILTKMYHCPVLLILLTVIYATNGFTRQEAEDTLTPSQFKCMKSSYPYFVASLQLKGGVAQFKKAITEANIAIDDKFKVDIEIDVEESMHPINDANLIVANLINFTSAFTLLWIDPQFKGNTSNGFVAYYTELLNAIKKGLPNLIGIISNKDSWNTNMNKSVAFSEYPLQYSTSSIISSFEDYQPFGGWLKPSMKRLLCGANACKTKVCILYY